MREPTQEEMEFMKADVEGLKARGIFTMMDLIHDIGMKKSREREEARKAAQSGNAGEQTE